MVRVTFHIVPFLLVYLGIVNQFKTVLGFHSMDRISPFSYTRSSTRTISRVRKQADAGTATPGTCNFGRGRGLMFCDWSARNGSFTWQLGNGRGAYFRGGPTLDANNEQDGGYVFVETSFVPPFTDRGRGDLSWLDSAVLEATEPEGRCFSFGYALDGISATRLRVLLQPEGNDEQTPLLNQTSNSGFFSSNPQVVVTPVRKAEPILLWQTRDNTQGAWNAMGIVYSFNQPHQIVIEALAEDSANPSRKFRGYIAVDNLNFGASSLCEGHCTFEGGFCDWSNDENDDFNWNLGRGSNNPATGPARDHSSFISGAPSGGYAYIDSSYPRRPGDVARMESKEFPATEGDQPKCLKFWTHMFGNGIGTLRVLLRQGESDPSELWSLSGDAGNNWYQGQVPISSTEAFKVVFEGVVGRNSLGDISIDDITLTPGTCPSGPQAAAASSGDCTFEIDECGWNNVGARESMDDTDWSRVPAEAARVPARDHTMATDKGYFMALSRGSTQRPGDRGWLISREVNGSATIKCFTFWYYLYEPVIDPSGPSLGTLQVLLRKEEGNRRLTSLWRLQNHQGGAWQYAQVEIKESANYKLIFEGLWGSSRSTGVIAIDDITFYSGECTTRPAKAAPLQAECNFHRDSCEWRNMSNATRPEVDWRLASLSRRPANLPDHTFGSPSGYVYFDIFTQAGRQETVKLVGPGILADSGRTNSLCFTFWFAVFGTGDSTQLRLFQHDFNPDSASRVPEDGGQEVWALSASQVDLGRPDWAFAQAPIDGSSNFRLVLEGKASNGGFAVDDIGLYEGNCELRPKVATTGGRDSSRG